MKTIAERLHDKVEPAANRGQLWVHVKVALLTAVMQEVERLRTELGRAMQEIDRLEKQLERADDRIQEKSRLKK